MLHGEISGVVELRSKIHSRPMLQQRIPFRPVSIFASVACLAMTAMPSVSSAGAAPLSGAELIERLRAGGCVLVVRHARSPQTAPDARTAKADNPHRERQLDQAGEADARALGSALRALHVPIGPIYSSPTYRARETVRLAGLGEP